MEPNSPHSGRENLNPFIANTAMGRVLGSDSHDRLHTFFPFDKWDEGWRFGSSLGIRNSLVTL